MVKIDSSTGDGRHNPRVSTIGENREYIESDLG